MNGPFNIFEKWAIYRIRVPIRKLYESTYGAQHILEVTKFKLLELHFYIYKFPNFLYYNPKSHDLAKVIGKWGHHHVGWRLIWIYIHTDTYIWVIYLLYVTRIYSLAVRTLLLVWFTSFKFNEKIKNEKYERSPLVRFKRWSLVFVSPPPLHFPSHSFTLFLFNIFVICSMFDPILSATRSFKLLVNSNKKNDYEKKFTDSSSNSLV